jgi:hypothetical protein
MSFLVAVMFHGLRIHLAYPVVIISDGGISTVEFSSLSIDPSRK